MLKKQSSITIASNWNATVVNLWVTKEEESSWSDLLEDIFKVGSLDL